MRAAHIVVGLVTALTLVGCDQSQEARAPLDSLSDVAAPRKAQQTASASPQTSHDIDLPASTDTVNESAAGATHDLDTASITLPKGLALAVRLDRSLSTARSRAGNAFHALLDSPLVVNGRTVLARGTRFSGHVTSSESSGRLRGRAELAITLDGVDIDGRRYPIETSVSTRRGAAHARRNLTFIGGGGGLGALVGGWTGSKKGLAIGTAVGAGAGTAVAASTGKLDVEVPAQQLYRFSLAKAVSIPG
ncbi:MAG: hypothetical protein U0Q11_16295 [Vicinamibacterales bacterium]